MSCPSCGSKNGVLVAYGVDGEGEWETCECEECARVWMERSTGMIVNGYEVGAKPTDEEFAIYRKVRDFHSSEWIARWLGYSERMGSAMRLTQEEFELLCHRFGKLDFSAEEEDALLYEYAGIVDGRKLAEWMNGLAERS